MGGASEKSHAGDSENEETAHPCPPFHSSNNLSAAKTIGKTDFTKSCNNQYYLVHNDVKSEKILFMAAVISGVSFPMTDTKVRKKYSEVRAPGN